MNRRNVLEMEPVELPDLPGIEEGLWMTLLELAEVQPDNWTLIGGQMVLLHALEQGASLPRVSTDLDVLVDARIATRAIRGLVHALQVRGFESAGMSPEGIAHRYARDGVSVDVLAPEGLGKRADLTTTPPGRTLEIPGGTQALKPTEFLLVVYRGRAGNVPRPSLLGALICKACAVAVDDVPHAQRSDFALLLSLIDDPLHMASELNKKDRQRLRIRAEMGDSAHPSWGTLDADAAARGLATYRLLTR